MSPATEATERYDASYCLSIVITSEEVGALVEQLDRFAVQESLSKDRDNPYQTTYAVGDKTAEISVLHGLGDFGSVLTYYEFKDTATPSVLERLRSFIEAEVIPNYQTEICQQNRKITIPETQ